MPSFISQGRALSEEDLWIETLQDFSPSAIDPSQYSPCYGQNVWELYNTGRIPSGCESGSYDYILARPEDFR